MDETMRRRLTALLLLIVSGCGVAPRAPDSEAQRVETPKEATERRAKATRPAYNLTGYPPAVRDGYIDGCESAKKTSFARKDARRMADDAQYSMGWNDGFSLCKPK
jgi:hypothetical protein